MQISLWHSFGLNMEFMLEVYVWKLPVVLRESLPVLYIKKDCLEICEKILQKHEGKVLTKKNPIKQGS